MGIRMRFWLRSQFTEAKNGLRFRAACMDLRIDIAGLLGVPFLYTHNVGHYIGWNCRFAGYSFGFVRI